MTEPITVAVLEDAPNSLNPLCFTCGGSRLVLVETGAIGCYLRPCADCPGPGNTNQHKKETRGMK